MILWIQLRHFKAYKWSNFIPVWEKYNFISYAWSNGIWKSSILEALDVFFNNKDWLLTKSETASNSFICPICLIPKNKVTRLKKDFEIIFLTYPLVLRYLDLEYLIKFIKSAEELKIEIPENIKYDIGYWLISTEIEVKTEKEKNLIKEIRDKLKLKKVLKKVYED